MIGMVLALLGFVISPTENVVKSTRFFFINLFSKGVTQTHLGSGDNVAGDKVINIERTPQLVEQEIKKLTPQVIVGVYYDPKAHLR